jgi:putative sterol carrier protein
MTLDDLFKIMLEKADKIELPEPITASIVLDITGDTPKTWQVDLNGTKISVSEGATDATLDEKPHLKVTTSDQVLLKVANRELKPTVAFFTGKIKVKGDVGLISHLKNLWPGE